jgi:Fe-S-cluster containining protein
MKMNSSTEYKCNQCGKCCRQFNLPVKNQEELIKKFNEHFGFKLKSYEIKVLFSGECEFLENNKCTNYENRPKLCKEFICKRYINADVPDGQLYKKRCRVCLNLRSFQKGTDRDLQSVCGNCWVW